jgi:hypothetical protein
MTTNTLDSICAEFTPKPTVFKPTGIPQLDIIWGGGTSSGRILEIHGEPGLGKSTLLLQTGLNRAEAGDKVLYVDTESALTLSLVNGVGTQASGFSIETDSGGCFRRLCPSSFVGVDRVFDAHLNEGFNLIILDTIAMVSPEYDGTKVDSRLSKTNPAEASRLQAELLRIYRPRFAREGATLLVGNQMRKEISGWRGRLKPCGGISLDHGLDIRTKLFPQKKLISACKSFHNLGVTTLKNRLGCPHEELPMHLHFGSGVKRSEALAMMLLHFKGFTSHRGQYVSPHLQKALHGMPAFRDWVERNEAHAYEILSEKVGFQLKSPFN